MLRHITQDPQYEPERAYVASQGADKLAAKANGIFLPHPPDLSLLKQALASAGMAGEIYTDKISFTDEEAVQFIMVPRLLEYFPEVPDLSRRRELVERVLRNEVLPTLPRDPNNPKAYLTFWTFGKFTKSAPSPSFPVSIPHSIAAAA